ncbi:MAG: 50S ribosomal protein L25 [Dehalococcoidia bacterium]
MDKIELKVAKRDILGKRVKHLRRQGITPLHVFGHGIESLALQCSTDQIERVLAQAGYTGLVNLKLDNEKKSRTVVVREFDRDWRKGQLLHVDFYQVRMDEKMRLEIPVVRVGEAPALKSKDNMLEHELDTLSVECLPGRIPTEIEVDISSLVEAGQSIRVKDVVLGEGVTVLNDPGLVVLKISLRPAARIEEEVAAEAAEAAKEAIEAPEEAAPDKEKTEET